MGSPADRKSHITDFKYGRQMNRSGRFKINYPLSTYCNTLIRARPLLLYRWENRQIAIVPPKPGESRYRAHDCHLGCSSAYSGTALVVFQGSLLSSSSEWNSVRLSVTDVSEEPSATISCRGQRVQVFF
jgi:hypothetical protein